MSDCLFCKIAEQSVPAEVVYEDASAVAFLDIMPRAPGHTMVVPRSHAGTILDMRPEDIGPLFTAVQRVVRQIQEALSPDGFTIGINHGRVSGQAIDHVHVHIVPRFQNDGGGSLHSIVHNPPQESVAEIAKKLRAHQKQT